jgi:hypothetical protein
VQKPALIISLDFELHWGRFDKYPLESNKYYYQNTREVVPRILELFERRQIKATWATVGMLMCENKEEWEYYKPLSLPTFENSKFSAYHWLESQENAAEIGLFAPELVRQILKTPGQELGSHSYAHYYCLEKGQTLAQWKADLQAAKLVARDKFGVELESLVFPRNQYSPASLDAAIEFGFKYFRTNPSDWFWEEVVNENLIKKVFRTGDTLIPLGNRTSYKSPAVFKSGLNIPASRILRPYREGSLFNHVRIGRIKKELEAAIERGEIYHLWWHPHNFGNYPKENLRILEDLLDWVKSKMDMDLLSSESMKSLSEKISSETTAKK